MKREEGYYWVKVKSRGGSTYGGTYPKWIIRYYYPPNEELEDDEYWRDGLENLYNPDEDYIEINENRIMPPA